MRTQHLVLLALHVMSMHPVSFHVNVSAFLWLGVSCSRCTAVQHNLMHHVGTLSLRMKGTGDVALAALIHLAAWIAIWCAPHKWLSC